MTVTIDLDLMCVVVSVFDRRPISAMSVKRGDSATFDVQFVRSNPTEYVALDSGSVITFGAKFQRKYDSVALVLDESFTAAATATATASITGSTVSSIAVTSGGTRYQTAPNVILSGGGGTGSTATAVLTNGVVTSILVSASGTGYTSAPTVTIDPPRPSYRGFPSFNTDAINTALMIDDNVANDLPSVTLMAEITWIDGVDGPISSTATFVLIINNDVVRGDEGAPTTLPTPDDWLEARRPAPLALTAVPIDGTTVGSLDQSAIVTHSDDTLTEWRCVDVAAKKWLPLGWIVRSDVPPYLWERGAIVAGSLKTLTLPDQ